MTSSASASLTWTLGIGSAIFHGMTSSSAIIVGEGAILRGRDVLNNRFLPLPLRSLISNVDIAVEPPRVLSRISMIGVWSR